MDLAGSIMEEAHSNLSILKQTCATDIQMKDGLITIYCKDDRTLSVLLINQEESLQIITQQQVFDDDSEIG